MNLSDYAEIDLRFARFIERFGGGEAVGLLVAALSRAVRGGHLCLDLRMPMELEEPWPSVEQWRERLASCRAIGGPEGNAPLVLDGAGRLYLRRFYEDEAALAAAICRWTDGNPVVDIPIVGQEAALETALARRLTLLCGGPGTGKTTTVVRILAGWLAENPRLRLATAAPTGKAAARLDEALRGGMGRWEEGSAVRGLLETLPRSRTLDGLLGTRPGSAKRRYDAENPLPVDALVIDEASMVALPQMAKVFAALPAGARVLLLGDRDQLASVAPGSLLADLVEAAPGHPLAASLVMLEKNYRFGNASGIYRLCQAIREGAVVEALEILSLPDQPDLGEWRLVPGQPLPLKGPVLRGYGPFLREDDPAKALTLFDRFRLLAAVREGAYGVEGLNLQIAGLLEQEGLVQPGRPGATYAHLPILVTRNAPALGLSNGDIGVFLPDPATPEDHRLWAWFPGGEAGVRRVAPARLPPHEPAWAMTIHKSQGSEFDEVLVLLPERDLPLLTRELVYTGLTRARRRAVLWHGPLREAIGRRADRASGLTDRLREGFGG